MRFLADQDVWKQTVDLIRAWGHDLITAGEIGLARASDEELLNQSRNENRLFITRDSDYGALVFLGRTLSGGVILLRIRPENQEEVHAELKNVLAVHGVDELRKSFCTVEAGRHRIRRITPE
jgi:predicted nuclease of predicted toxin-antitoxin system